MPPTPPQPHPEPGPGRLKSLYTCWECAEFPCGEDMHGPSHDLRIRAFVAFIRSEGTEALVDCLLRNEADGIHYGQGRDYDGKSSEGEVIRLLKTGLSAWHSSDAQCGM
jgi:hypothetical protein